MSEPSLPGGIDPLGPLTLLQRVAQGDREAVRECLGRHGGLVWSMARRLLAGRPDVEDAVQDVFIALWSNAARYDPTVAAEATFVALIARRTLIDRLRRQGRQPQIASLPADLVSLAPEPADRLEQADQANQAAQALRSLGDEQRQVLTLAIYQGLTHQAIAQATGLPLGTVKTHARRGLIQLRKMLGVESSIESPVGPTTAPKGGKG